MGILNKLETAVEDYRITMMGSGLHGTVYNDAIANLVSMGLDEEDAVLELQEIYDEWVYKTQ